MSYDPNQPTNVDKRNTISQTSGNPSGGRYEPYSGSENRRSVFDIRIDTDSIPENRDTSADDRDERREN